MRTGTTQESRDKALFRRTALWARFKIKMSGLQMGLDKITQKPLHKGWNLHHLDLKFENYKKLDPEHFACLNLTTHEFIHWLFPYYKKDPQIIERIREMMQLMAMLNAPECDKLYINGTDLLCSKYDYPSFCNNCVNQKKECSKKGKKKNESK
ncbi:MAG: hypothetical protein MJ174_07385 [Treponema sp.]|nr:hypothetical protein [Treponema sp.]